MHFHDFISQAPPRLDHSNSFATSLLKSAALALLLTTGLLSTAVADGGAGGNGPNGKGGGAGGVGNTSAPGETGTDLGGGGGGASGGAGGPSGSNVAGGVGGLGVGAGGGGGGGGGSTTEGTGDAVATSPIQGTGGAAGGAGPGGAGGAGGVAGVAATAVASNAPGSDATGTSRAGGGGGGGAGGAGLTFNGSVLNASGSVIGGAGGAGSIGGVAATSASSDLGNATAISLAGGSGAGGSGGAGLLLSGERSRFSLGGTFDGGDGGVALAGSGVAAAAASSAAGNATGQAAAGAGLSGGVGGAGAIISGLGSTTFVGSSLISGGDGGLGGLGGVSSTAANTGGLGTGSATAIAQSGGAGAGGQGGNGISLMGADATLTVLDSSVAGGAGGAGGLSGGSSTASAAGVAGLSNAAATASDGGAGGRGGDGMSILGDGASLTITNSSVGGGAGAAGGPGGSASAASQGPTPTVNATAGAGASGGSGGNAITIDGAGASIVNAGTLTGGNGATGGAGGNATAAQMIVGGGTPGQLSALAGTGGNGGAGGAGLVVTRSAASLTNAGSISGGNGGAAGAGGASTINNVAGMPAASGLSGAGGAGVVANGIRIDNTGGTIAGGLAGDGVTRAFAIALTGGPNFVGGAGQIIGGIDVQGGALFQPGLPGAPVGTPLAVTGPLQFAQTSTYQIRIVGPANDSVQATGGATLNGARVVVQAPGAAPINGTRYAILTATGGVAGTFNPNVGSNLAFFRPVLSYDATNVFLDSAYNYVLAGGTQNQMNVGAGLNFVANGSLSPAGQRIFGALNLVPNGQGGAVLDSLSGEGITAAQNIAYRSAQLFNSAIADQTTFYGAGTANSITLTEQQPGFTALATPEQTLAAANAGKKVRELADLPNRRAEPVMPALAAVRTWRAWATGFGAVENIQGNGRIGSAAQNNTLVGGALGVDYQLLPNYLVGVALGGSDGTFRVNNRGTSGSTAGGHVAIYDVATLGAFYGATSSSFSYFGNRTTRFVQGFGGLGAETERGNFNSYEFRNRIEIGRHFDGPFGLGAFGSLTPFLALELAQLRSNGFTESSISGPGLFRLNVSGQSAASVPGYVGARVQRVTPLGNGMVLTPTLQVAYVHEFAPFRSQTGQIAALPGSVFLVDGARPARHAAQVKAGGELTLGPRAALFANFDGEFSGINQLYAGKGGLRYLW